MNIKYEDGLARRVEVISKLERDLEVAIQAERDIEAFNGSNTILASIEDLKKRIRYHKSELEEVKYLAEEGYRVPLRNELYFYITPFLEINSEYFCNRYEDVKLLKLGNYFTTEEECEIAIEKIKAILNEHTVAE